MKKNIFNYTDRHNNFAGHSAKKKTNNPAKPATTRSTIADTLPSRTVTVTSAFSLL
jgi:hypothetical protein